LLPPEELEASDVMRVISTHSPEKLVSAVLANLHVFCSLRTRVGLSETRAKAVGALTESKRLSTLAAFIHDESHIRALEPSLKELEKRLRTACLKLTAFREQLERRHRSFSKLGALAISSADIAMAQWTLARSEALEQDLAFFRLDLQGQRFAEHRDPIDSKAWHPVLNAALVRLKNAGMKSDERKALFPVRFTRTTDPDQRRIETDRESKARGRAKKKVKTGR